jgi:hypothetical protein
MEHAQSGHAGVPGFVDLATSLMNMTVKCQGVTSIPELRDPCIEAEVNRVDYQMAGDLFVGMGAGATP